MRNKISKIISLTLFGEIRAGKTSVNANLDFENIKFYKVGLNRADPLPLCNHII